MWGARKPALSGLPPAPSLAPDTQQGTPPRAKSLFDTLFHRVSPRTQANSTPASPATQSDTALSASGTSPQQGTAAPLPGSNSANAAPTSAVTQSAVLPSPAARSSVLPSPAAQSSAAKPTTSATAEIPAADLAPLYDYVQDCRACQLQLAAAKQNAIDEATKITALIRERDAALTAAKGGSFWLRLKRNAHWLAVGAAIGAVTSTAALCRTGRCR